MRGSRRASAIVAVLLLLAIGVVIAASVLVTADAAATMSRAEMGRVQSRALAWSGLQGVMAELAEQRDAILDGEAPEITAEWSLFTFDDGTRAVVRLVDFAPDDPGLVVAENAKLDLNSATAETLARVPGLTPELAAAIVAAREAGPFASVEQLLSVEGVGPSLLYGPGEQPGYAPSPSGEPARGGQSGLGHFLTVFCFDPNIQMGLDGDDDARGTPRINLNQPWSDDLDDALASRFDETVASAIRALMEAGRTFTSDRDIVQSLIDSGTDPEDWPRLLDGLTSSADPYLAGRIDLNRAPPEVLACLPGLTAQHATQLADARESLDPVTRQCAAWAVAEGILTPDEFAGVADRLTTRSTQWRVRIEAGLERGGGDEPPAPLLAAPAPGQTGDFPPAGDAPIPALQHRMVYEAVIDIASARPRLAYLREVTVLEPILAMLSEQADNETDGGYGGPELPPAESPAAPATDAAPDPEGSDSSDGADADPRAGSRPGGRRAAPEAPEEPTGTEAGEESPEPAGGTDRRIGRWNTRRVSEP